MNKIFVWDAPTRLFHWLLVLCFIGLMVSGKSGRLDIHAILGCGMIGLLSFRLLWGLFGSETARFRYFLRPSKIRAYLKGEYKPIGHNPLGALMVMGFLSLLATQAILGLFSNDTILFEGPFAQYISNALSDQLTSIHIILVKFIIAMVVIHIVAIIFYRVVKKEKLTSAMIKGWYHSKIMPEKLPFFVSNIHHIIIIPIAIFIGLLLIYLLP